VVEKQRIKIAKTFRRTRKSANKSIAAKVGREEWAVGCKSLSATVSADEQSQTKVLIFNYKTIPSGSTGQTL
jgi:hypothetical protein